MGEQRDSKRLQPSRSLQYRAPTAGFLVVWVACMVALPAAWAEEVRSWKVVDSEGIYYGEGEHPKAPAVISADEVWDAIPEYRKIVDQDLSEDDPKYHLLMKRATERFQKALGKIAKRESYDMIGEVGSIESAGDVKKDPPDATADMVDAVSRDS